MIVVGEHPEGLIVPVRAQPGARRPGVQGEQNGALKIAVRAPALEGRANAALVEALAEALEIKRSQVELVGGAGGRDKRFLVRGVARSELERRLAFLV